MRSKSVWRGLVLASIVIGIGISGCASKVRSSTDFNPPPTEPFSAFGRIELNSVRVEPGVSASPSGVAKIDENLKKELAESLRFWNSGAGNGRTLVIDPVVEHLDFKHGAGRVLLGPLVGGSGVLLRLRISDAQGKVVASPEFVQRTGAWSGGMTLGVMDNLMLPRVAWLASDYVQTNYLRARGGKTGANDPRPKTHTPSAQSSQLAPAVPLPASAAASSP